MPHTRSFLRSVFLSLFFIVSSFGAAVATAQGLWSAPHNLNTPGPSLASVAGGVDLQVDAAGNAIAVWQAQPVSTRQQIEAARFVQARGEWSPSVAISPATSDASGARLAVLGTGDAIAVWTITVDQRTVVQAARFDVASLAWAAPVTLSTGPADDDATPEIGVDATGNAIAIWIRESDSSRVYGSRYTVGGAWSVPAAISPVGAAASRPRVAVDATGNGLAVWVSAITDTRSSITAARYTAAGDSWQVLGDISPVDLFVDSPDLAMDAAGSAVAVWTYGPATSSGSMVQAARFRAASGAWTFYEAVSAFVPATYRPQVAMNAVGVASAIWTTDTGVEFLVQASRLAPGAQSWSAAQTIARQAFTEKGGEPRMTLDSEGNALASWWRSDGFQRIVRAAFYHQASNAWTSGTDLSTATEVAQAPAVALAANGQAVVAWAAVLQNVNRVRAAAAILPAAPTLDSAVVDRSNVSLSWSVPPAGPPASAYTVVASYGPGSPIIAALPAGTATALTVSAPVGTYYVRVLAAMAGETIASNEIRVDVTPGPAPTIPLNLTFSVNGSIVTLTWSPPANAASALLSTYVIEAGSAPGLLNYANFSTGSTATTYMASVPDGNYYVRLRATGIGGTGPATADVRVIVGPPPPNAPTLSGDVGPSRSVSLLWTTPTTGAAVTGYQLQAGSASGLSDIVTYALPATSTTFGVTNVPPGTYYVRVVPLSVSGPGEASNELVLVVP